MIMHESAEMYLETIYLLHQRKTPVRAVDIAAEMGYSKPTISEWMGKLRDGGYVTVEDGGIELTKQGRDLASKIYERHVLLTELLQSAGVDAETAAQDACRLEHYISDTTFECLKNHYRGQAD
jgi:Mn-dependent DtxR family transcriptional regulator